MQIKPLKKLGQNFLTNRGITEKIIKSADLKPDDVVLEIGPGLGVLTKRLAEKAKKVITVEKDKRLIETLEQELKGYKNVEIINEDILKFNLNSRLRSPRCSFGEAGGNDSKYKVVANLPFYIASPVIQKFLEAENRPTEMILLVQKEVAQRITAKPPKMSLLAVSVQFYAKPEILFYVSKGSFRPSPKVDAACLKISPLPIWERRSLSQVRAGFAHPRKQLGSNLPKDLLLKAGIDPTRRAETLTVEEWKLLHKASALHI